MKIHLGKLLNEKGLTISELHQLTGIARTTLTPLSKEEILPSKTRFDTLDKICNALNIDESELLSFEDEWDFSLIKVKRWNSKQKLSYETRKEELLLVFLARRNNVERFLVIKASLDYILSNAINEIIDREADEQGLSFLKTDFEKYNELIKNVVNDNIDKLSLDEIRLSFIPSSELQFSNLSELYQANHFDNIKDNYHKILPMTNIDGSFIYKNIVPIINVIFDNEAINTKVTKEKIEITANIATEYYDCTFYWNYYTNQKLLEKNYRFSNLVF
ncbi:helix-turn-helix transcriptional regulator [Enterococcus cecorum]|uniref:helix-turn-helix domain-containing protein n=1 Tax=Enterococcus cecorum TaxID=44008 RepID=UPI0022CF9D06|nr:helix-turn-helix transcriptional regulator [Enterococcus cecorum]CAI3338409.1 helix-turn-helix transcriptional regulator [Enterococcus cecorum]CAI3388970.1 helix-turn-helix transcriptional regulator [Enterococcus cecorum]CAI3396535.1 helix-turn-helix transcriptional regulator [Enterococcus cecorum]CAI3409625.1 helix-turn-helix transcriptional regulator [Enterococcus cecorum]